MDKLNAEQSRALAMLLREEARLAREVAAARALLTLCERNKVYPQNWEQTLEDMRNLPEYSRTAQDLDTIATHLEQSANEIDLNELLQMLPQGKPSN